MESLRTWLAENPKSRPLILLGVAALLTGLFAGVLMVHSRRRSHEIDRAAMSANATAPTEEVPTITGGAAEEQIGESPLPPKSAWVSDKGAEGRPTAGLDVPPTRHLQPGEEVSWIREENQWDQIRTSDGVELWVQNKAISLVRPSTSAQKPGGAELTVQAFYQAVERHDYAGAYKFLAPEWKAELDFDHFVRGYDRAENVRSEITRVVPLSEDRSQVDIKVVANEFGSKVTYLGFYTCEKKGDDWKMASGELNRTVDPEPAPVPASTEALPAPAEAVPAPPAAATPETLPSPAATPTAAATPAPAETDNPGGGF